MRERNFSLSDLLKQIGAGADEKVKKAFAKLAPVEMQAVAATRLMRSHGYLPLPAFGGKLHQQNLPAVELALVVAYLAGYNSAETFDSSFDVSVFGEMSAGLEEKSVIVKSTLAALINLMRENGVTELPDRRPVAKAKRFTNRSKMKATKTRRRLK